MKKVSVVLASYNGEKYLQSQIDSIFKQSGVICKLFVRDDGSSDSTKKILEENQKQGKLTWYAGPHLSVAQGFLELLKNVEDADYYAFCDQDDIWLSDKLISAVKKIELENDSLPLMYCSSTTLVDENLKSITTHCININRTNLARFIFNDMSGNTIVINNTLRNYLCDVDRPLISIHDKWCVQLCLAIGGKCIVDSESHILYRQHSNNTIGMELTFFDKVKKFLDICDMPHDINMDVLKNEYTSFLIEPYKSFIYLACKEKLTFEERIRLICDENVKFGNRMFDLAFKIRTLKGLI